MDATFVDFYATLGCTPDISPDQLDKTMLALVKKYQAASDKTEVAEFLKIKEAYTVLKNPKSKAKFDAIYQAQMKQTPAAQSTDPTEAIDSIQSMVGEMEEAESETCEKENAVLNDAEDRHQLLLKFYERRRKNMKEPGVGAGGLEAEVHYPKNVLEFHLWYFRERGWIERLEGGQLAITAAGVDKIELRVDA